MTDLEQLQRRLDADRDEHRQSLHELSKRADKDLALTTAALQGLERRLDEAEKGIRELNAADDRMRVLLYEHVARLGQRIGRLELAANV